MMLHTGRSWTAERDEHALSAPLETHWGPASCEDVGCEKFLRGFATIVPSSGPLADYIRHDRTRMHTEERQEGGLSRFVFQPGTPCFEQHRLCERPAILHRTVRAGERQVLTAEQWMDSWNDNAYRVNRAIEAAG